MTAHQTPALPAGQRGGLFSPRSAARPIPQPSPMRVLLRIWVQAAMQGRGSAVGALHTNSSQPTHGHAGPTTAPTLLGRSGNSAHRARKVESPAPHSASRLT